MNTFSVCICCLHLLPPANRNLPTCYQLFFVTAVRFANVALLPPLLLPPQLLLLLPLLLLPLLLLPLPLLLLLLPLLLLPLLSCFYFIPYFIIASIFSFNIRLTSLPSILPRYFSMTIPMRGPTAAGPFSWMKDVFSAMMASI